MIDKREQSITFDPSWLVNLSEKILLETKGSGLARPSSIVRCSNVSRARGSFVLEQCTKSHRSCPRRPG